jgi:hypothetical protein
MAYQFCCPQGHILQGELSIVGHVMQCPMCGSEFHVPPPDAGAATSEGYLQGPPMWPAQGVQGGYPPPAGPTFGMPGAMLQPPMMPSGPFAPPPFPTPQFGAPGEVTMQPPAAASKPAEVPAA